jgi:hypothetical protein
MHACDPKALDLVCIDTRNCEFTLACIENVNEFMDSVRQVADRIGPDRRAIPNDRKRFRKGVDKILLEEKGDEARDRCQVPGGSASTRG